MVTIAHFFMHGYIMYFRLSNRSQLFVQTACSKCVQWAVIRPRNSFGSLCDKVLLPYFSTNCAYAFCYIGMCLHINSCNAVVTCEIKLFQNYFSLQKHPCEVILFQRMETCQKLFQNYFTGLLQLMNIFQHVHCCWNNSEIISELLQRLK